MLGPLPQSSQWQLSLMTSNLVVVYPHGAGGVWLRCVIGWCITRCDWEQQQVNFHQSPINLISHRHEYAQVDHALSISDPSCKYNFWKLYVRKRFIHELEYLREKGQRLVLCPYSTFYNIQSNKDNFFWMLDQCKYIQSYNWTGRFEVKWQNLFRDPEQVWDTICRFLEFNQQKNYHTFNDFKIPLANYKNTCARIIPKINFNQKHFLIWSLAYLQHRQIHAPFDVFENFNTNIMLDWVKHYEEDIIGFTQSSMYSYSK